MVKAALSLLLRKVKLEPDMYCNMNPQNTNYLKTKLCNIREGFLNFNWTCRIQNTAEKSCSVWKDNKSFGSFYSEIPFTKPHLRLTIDQVVFIFT